MDKSLKLEWKHLNLSVKPRNSSFWKRSSERKVQLLKDVSGVLESTNMVAVLGSSGAGKTSLMTTISQRSHHKLYTGDILLNGVQVDKSTMTKVSCFVPQRDIMYDILTIQEHLDFMCDLKGIRRSHKQEKIKYVLEKCGLNEKTSRRIAHLSGGEKKLLSLATELITNPPIIFCDEPTTGLDSFNALRLIQNLKKLTEDEVEGTSMKRAVLCTIHQPTSEVFHQFTHIVLVQEGQIAFQGTTREAELFFERSGFACPMQFNPAEFYIKVLSEKKIKLPALTSKIDEASTSKAYPSDGIEMDYPLNKSSTKDVMNMTEKKNRRWCSQALILLRRSYLDTKRRFFEQMLRTVTFFITCMTITMLYSNVTGIDQTAVQNIQGVIFNLVAHVFFTFSYGVIFILPTHVPIMRKEVGEDIYSVSAYYFAIVTILIPKVFIEVITCFSVVFLSLDFLNGFELFLKMGLTLFVTGVMAMAHGFMLSGFSDSVNVASELAGPVDMIILLFGGFYLSLNSKYSIVKYLSIFFYSNEMLSIHYWADVTEIACKQNSSISCLRNGKEVLENFSFATDITNVWWDLLGLGILFCVMHFIGFVGCRRYVKNKAFY